MRSTRSPASVARSRGRCAGAGSARSCGNRPGDVQLALRSVPALGHAAHGDRGRAAAAAARERRDAPRTVRPEGLLGAAPDGRGAGTGPRARPNDDELHDVDRGARCSAASAAGSRAGCAAIPERVWYNRGAMPPADSPEDPPKSGPVESAPISTDLAATRDARILERFGSGARPARHLVRGHARLGAALPRTLGFPLFIIAVAYHRPPGAPAVRVRGAHRVHPRAGRPAHVAAPRRRARGCRAGSRSSSATSCSSPVVVGFMFLLVPRLSRDVARLGKEAPGLYKRINERVHPAARALAREPVPVAAAAPSRCRRSSRSCPRSRSRRAPRSR